MPRFVLRFFLNSPSFYAELSSPSALSEDSFIQSETEKEKRSGPPVERETGRLNLTRNPSYRPARHPTTPLFGFKMNLYPEVLHVT